MQSQGNEEERQANNFLQNNIPGLGKSFKNSTLKSFITIIKRCFRENRGLVVVAYSLQVPSLLFAEKLYYKSRFGLRAAGIDRISIKNPEIKTRNTL